MMLISVTKQREVPLGRIFPRPIRTAFLIVSVSSCLCSCAAAAPKIPDKPTAAAKADAIKFYKEIAAATVQCDKALNALQNMGSSASVDELRKAAKLTAPACRSVGIQVAAVQVPVNVGKSYFPRFTQGHDSCVAAYRAASLVAAQAAKDMGSQDGGKMRSLQKAWANMVVKRLECSIRLVAPPMELGATVEDLGGKSRDPVNAAPKSEQTNN